MACSGTALLYFLTLPANYISAMTVKVKVVKTVMLQSDVLSRKAQSPLTALPWQGYKAKAVPLHATKTLGKGGGIAPTHY
jgi:hypothetical protein